MFWGWRKHTFWENCKKQVQEHIDKNENQDYNSKPIENPEGIIDSLFNQQEVLENIEIEEQKSEHIVDPEDYALYKKYLA